MHDNYPPNVTSEMIEEAFDIESPFLDMQEIAFENDKKMSVEERLDQLKYWHRF